MVRTRALGFPEVSRRKHEGEKTYTENLVAIYYIIQKLTQISVNSPFQPSTTSLSEIQIAFK